VLEEVDLQVQVLDPVLVEMEVKEQILQEFLLQPLVVVMELAVEEELVLIQVDQEDQVAVDQLVTQLLNLTLEDQELKQHNQVTLELMVLVIMVVVVILLEILFIVLVVVVVVVQLEEVDLQVVLEQAVREKM
tara:strand:+ start:264 stop:662 length:399 start_codon:yes stop_codon:yes gene_type:complete